MAAGDDSSDLTSLSSLSPALSDDELDMVPQAKSASILNFFPKLSGKPPKDASPPPRKRSPSPAHEYVLADDPSIAFIVMFRNRFSEAFPKSLPHFGPQELERDVVESVPGERVEHFLCALLGLLLNRKQDVKPGHYGRALEDAIASHKTQWPTVWQTKNPLSGGNTFNSMTPAERLLLLRTLILWTMSSSETVKTLINQSYKQNRHEDDINQPRAVQPWGSDGDKRRYFLIEGQDDSHFRVYRESNPAGTNRTWWSVASDIDQLKALAAKLDTRDGGPKAKKLSHKILQAIPRFEAGEEKRKRREYRQMRKEQFKRPEPGFSLYEGRTRGKRMKYTYSDEEDTLSDSTTNRRSARNTGATTPAAMGPVTTTSGRQVRAPPRLNMLGEGVASGGGKVEGSATDNEVGPSGRPRRTAAINHGINGWAGNKSRQRASDDSDEESDMEFGDDEDEADADAQIVDESDDEDEFDEDEIMADDDLGEQAQSLVVKFSVTPPKLRTVLTHVGQAFNVLPTPETQDEGFIKSSGPETPLAPRDDMPVRESISVAAVSPMHNADMSPTNSGKQRQATPPLQPLDEDARLQMAPAAPSPSLVWRGSPEKAPPQQPTMEVFGRP
ncbi:hypothetical protein CDD82_5142 [Ophiocordyceps australis]|uniref:WHIM1 domain-containing protein n=1 Tax=Ophiocordyceps australis TaxID=1399860 RepID=A0A2C5ZS70_9HYPO|nr:hypothetical protein CDD82_5142 [Ophiocordyceps australis]